MYINLSFLYSGYDGNKNWLFSTKNNIEYPEKLNPIKRANKYKLEDNPKKSNKSYHQQSDIFNKNPDNSSNIKGIQGYKNASNVFNFSQPNQAPKGIRSYHLESDILFTKNPGKEEKSGINRATKNEESKINPEKTEKIKKNVGRDFIRTNDEWDLTSKKTAKYKNEPNPDNGLAFDFSNKPVYIGKTDKKYLPEKRKETEPEIQRGKKLFMKKK